MIDLYSSFETICPYVRFVGIGNYLSFEPTKTRAAYDNRLFLIRSGSAEIFIKGHTYPLRVGDAFIMLAGTPYKFITKDKTFSFFVVNFDFFTSEKNKKNTTPLPLPMCDAEKFNKIKKTENINVKGGFLEEGYYIEKQAFYLQNNLETMLTEYKRMEFLFEPQLSSLLKVCLNDIYRHSSYNQLNRLKGRTDILTFISEHFCEEITNLSVANEFHYHPNYISQLIKEQTGISLHQYLLRLRMLKAADLLLSCNFPISEIAIQCGFNDPSYFTQYFKKFFGCSPKTFRNEK